MQAYSGIRTAAWAVEHADPRAESPLESLGRLVFLAAGRRPPLSNVWIWSGSERYRVDHLLPDVALVLEADGALKYNLRPDAADVIRAQNRRQEALQRWGYGVVRYTWADVHMPAQFLWRVDAAVRARPAIPPTARWTQDAPAGFAA